MEYCKFKLLRILPLAWRNFIGAKNKVYQDYRMKMLYITFVTINSAILNPYLFDRCLN